MCFWLILRHLNGDIIKKNDDMMWLKEICKNKRDKKRHHIMGFTVTLMAQHSGLLTHFRSFTSLMWLLNNVAHTGSI